MISWYETKAVVVFFIALKVEEMTIFEQGLFVQSTELCHIKVTSYAVHSDYECNFLFIGSREIHVYAVLGRKDEMRQQSVAIS
jgi:hypothetical protein